MVSRIQNEIQYSENLFSHNPRVENNNAISSIDGATRETLRAIK